MQSYVLRCDMRVPRPIEETFSVFENPHNLAHITPPWLGFRVLHGPLEMAQGLEINYTVRWLGLPIRWRTVISAYQPPVRFVDFQARGPYLLWNHVHRFASDGEGTIVTDQVTYILPFGLLGRLAHAFIVKRQLLGIFRFRQQALAELLGGAAELQEPCIETGSTVTEQQLADYRA